MNDKKYLKWLLSMVTAPNYRLKYKELLLRLNSVPFKAIIPKDENRIADALELREDYEYETGHKMSLIDKYSKCTVLETMIALAVRAAQTITVDPEFPAELFRSMLTNLRLIRLNGEPVSNDQQTHIISRFVNRQYSANGAGGLFTVNNGLDMRSVELWYQAMYYLDQSTD